MPDRLWNIAKSIGNGEFNKGVRKMAEVSIGQKGILWAVPIQPLKLDRLYPIVPHEHVTLMFGVERNSVEEYEGGIFSALITGIANNDRIQAAKVILPTGIPFSLQIPHITLSHISDAAPVESTAMLQGASIVEIEPILMSFTIEFFQFSI